MSGQDSSEDYKKNCLTLNNNSPEIIARLKTDLKEILGIEEEGFEGIGIFFWNNRISLYKSKKGEETYVRTKSGSICEYSKHPDSNIKEPEKKVEDVPGFCALIPILEEKGITQEKIEAVRKAVERYNEMSKKLNVEGNCQENPSTPLESPWEDGAVEI